MLEKLEEQKLSDFSLDDRTKLIFFIFFLTLSMCLVRRKDYKGK